MDPLTAGLISGAGALGGGILSYFGNKDAQEQNQSQFEQNWQHNLYMVNSARDYNTWMANTAHQREMIDLRQAGINPMMTAMGGNGAPAPTSPTTNPGVGNAIQPNNALGNAIGGAVGTAIQAARTIADVKNVEKDSLLKEATALSTAAQAQQSTATAKQLTEVTAQLQRSRDANAAKADAEKNKAHLDQTYGAAERLLGVIKQGSGIANDASSAVSNLLPSKFLKNALQKGWNEGFKQGARNGIPLP